MIIKPISVITRSAIIPVALSLAACGSASDAPTTPAPAAKEVVEQVKQSVSDDTVLFDFNGSEVPSELTVKYIAASLITAEGDNGKAVKLDMATKEHYESSFSIVPTKAWDWSKQGDFAFAIDIINTEPHSTMLYSTVEDELGQTHNRSVVVPANSNETYFIELKGSDLMLDSGLRGNPSDWLTEFTPLIWRWGVKNLDLSKIKQVSFSINTQTQDRSLIIDNARLIKAEQKDAEYLTNIIDRYGQNAKVDFVGKIKNDQQLAKVTAEEATALRQTPVDGRSKFGGWKDGPKLKATGYFRTEKVDGKWAMVDPEGYLFFTHGIANIRMSNTSTITGYGFDADKVKARTADDLTPEDSLGLNRVSDEAALTRNVISDQRANMFEWLPNYDEPLGKHFGYRRETHQGPVKAGETYSFYQANLERKFGLQDQEELTQRWRENTVDRMLTWGFSSFGNWVDPGFYQMDRLPYFANGWIIGDFKTVSSGNDYWAPLPDPYDPKFAERADITIAKVAKDVKGNPWCVGIFIDNEKSWGNESSDEARFGIVINTLTLSASDSPSKHEFSKLAKAKYKNIAAFNAAWGIELSAWSEFDKGFEFTTINAEVKADLSQMLEHYASEYFRIVSGTVKKYMPNHMYMGARLASWGMTPEIRKAAAKYSDVMTYNVYKESIHPDSWRFLEKLDMPSVVGEFHMGAPDAGFANPGLVLASDQTDRARLYSNYMATVVDNPYFVGAHWFQYIDSPLSGRAYDGENYNVGFVGVTDMPYAPMIDAVKKFNASIYKRRFGELKR